MGQTQSDLEHFIAPDTIKRHGLIDRAMRGYEIELGTYTKDMKERMVSYIHLSTSRRKR